jgi:MtfA peptidase
MNIFAIILLCIPILLFIGAMRDGWAIFSRIYSIGKLFQSKEKSLEQELYLEKFTYYQTLSAPEKQRFLKRVQSFIYSKDFIGKNGLEITEEIKVMIAASAVQLTFGLKNYLLENIENIFIYPETFYGANKSQHFKGAILQGGIHFSWKDFKEGYKVSNDKYNLGLHEMSHALKLSLLAETDFDSTFGSYLDRWEEISEKELQSLQRGYPSFLRPYAKSNSQEFFAVCVEHFFEAPEEFRKALPDIFNHLVLLLNQNPANKTNDYKVDEDFRFKVNNDPTRIPLPEKIKRSYKYSSWHWSLTVLFIGIFGGSFSLMFLYPVTVVPTYIFLLMFFSAGVVGMQQWKYFRERQILADTQFFIYCFIGFAPSLFAIFLWINFLIPGSGIISETHSIIGYETRYKQASPRNRYHTPPSGIEGYVLHLKNAAYENIPVVRKVGVDFKDQKKVIIKFQRGVFGLRILKGYSFQ